MLTTPEFLIRILKCNRPLCAEVLHTGMSADFYKIGRQLREHSGGEKKVYRYLKEDKLLKRNALQDEEHLNCHGMSLCSASQEIVFFLLHINLTRQ
jgi:hypothetical protein